MPLRALLGPHDKTGLVDLARGLRDLGVVLVATAGTHRVLSAAGLAAATVESLTGHPEMLDGRVKTLHPAVHAGILARRDRDEHMRQITDHGYAPIDIVVVGLYPFEETAAGGRADPEVVEMIDIGGPALIRAAAKNHAAVAVVVRPEQYGLLLDELRGHGAVREETRRRLAAEAFAHTAAYDTAVAAWLRARSGGASLSPAPERFTVGGRRLAELRYGENPHQRGALYAVPGPPGGVAHARRLQGPELSYTNWLDVDAARRIVLEFDEPAAVVIKHTNPCGFATAEDIAAAYSAAFACDERAAFGGIVGLNRELDLQTAEALARTFLEAVVAPSISDEAAERLRGRERLRVLTVDAPAPDHQEWVRSIDGGLLVQTRDRVVVDRSTLRVPTRRPPSDDEWRDLLVAWRLCRHVTSNAVVVVAGGAGVGVGAGQMSRVEAAELAVARAGERARGAAAASDAFFPFPDGLEVLTNGGVRAVIQPGGSRGDDAVVAAADAAGVAMVFAGERHFRH